ncbi:MAG: AglZ/HisF2 family acetamidino modification protein [Bacteroidales bacterium]|nr:AglZ/HisF2 family acetamidino modification protein [Bacteroidales bacterium]
MFRPRVIPCLLLKNLGLVKSVKFKDFRYIGDPINAVKIFNDKKADELVFLDITASGEKRNVALKLIKDIGDECNMPFSVGGGIRTIENIKEILNAGAEKVCINSYAFENPEFIRKASETFGSSTIVISIDVKKNIFGKQNVYIYSGTKNTGIDPVAHAKNMEMFGAGEIIINSIDKDGTMEGYDIDLIKKVSDAVSIPVIALGGAGKAGDFKTAVDEGNASAVAAGSLFVYHGPRRAVLISFPKNEELLEIFKN